jgi:hypothetical protein
MRSSYRTRTATVDVDIDLDDFDDDELIDEIESRGLSYNSEFIDASHARDMLVTIHQLRRTGQSYDAELGQLIYYVLGRIV